MLKSNNVLLKMNERDLWIQINFMDKTPLVSDFKLPQYFSGKNQYFVIQQQLFNISN